MVFILKDCVEYDCIYGVLVFKDDSVSREEIQNEIGKIKGKLYYTEDVPDWSVEDDILPKLLEKYDFEYYDYNLNDCTLFC